MPKPQASRSTLPSRRALEDLLGPQGFACALSGAPLTSATATVDHKTAKSQGGTDEIGNLHWVLKKVNKAKGAMTVEEFVSMCCRVADHARRGSVATAAAPGSAGSSLASPASAAAS